MSAAPRGCILSSSSSIHNIPSATQSATFHPIRPIRTILWHPFISCNARPSHQIYALPYSLCNLSHSIFLAAVTSLCLGTPLDYMRALRLFFAQDPGANTHPPTHTTSSSSHETLVESVTFVFSSLLAVLSSRFYSRRLAARRRKHQNSTSSGEESNGTLKVVVSIGV